MGRGHKKVYDEALLLSYKEYGNVWKVAEAHDMCGQSVYERLSRLGVVSKLRVFSEADKKILINNYVVFKNQGKLDDLAKSLGRTKQFICRQAKTLGLTDPRSFKPYAEKKGSNPYAKHHARVRSKKGSPPSPAQPSDAQGT